MLIGIFDIDEYVPIPVPTHQFSSGAAYQPTSLTYSIYDAGNSEPIVEDADMVPTSPFDSITGAYAPVCQITAAAGFAVNKTYIVIIKATVDSVSPIAIYTFQTRVKPAIAGDKMDLLDAPNAAAVAAIQSGLAADVATAVHDTVIEGTLKFKSIIKVILAFAAGKSTGGGTAEIKFRDNADSKDRITATVDENGNRTTVTLDGD